MLGSRRRKALPTAEKRFADLPVTELPGGLRLFEAATWAARRDGLSGLDRLPSGWGLHLRPCRSIHMAGMNFPLDLVWIDGNGDVVRQDADVAPGRLRTCLRARSVLEVPAGEGDWFARAYGSSRS